MKIWFIKSVNKKEFEERNAKANNCEFIAEQMCNEEKGVSFLNRNPKNIFSFIDLIEPYMNNEDYFEVSVNVDFHDNDHC